jgi:glycosyltransferase involved in cell wall biosynthesis
LDKPETITPPALRILLVVNLPWDTRLGAIRVYLELMERWRAAGHTVEKFSLSDAFPNTQFARVGFAVRQVLFAYKAAAFVRKNAGRFDIVDAVIGSLHRGKEKLGFGGLLVARSVGLLRSYERYEPKAGARGKLAGRILYTAIGRWMKHASDAAVRRADIINVPNEDEARVLREDVHVDLPIVVEPYGLTSERRHALAQAAAPAAQRLAQKKISFIGMWGPRKGALDWPKIMRHIWHRAPDARFSLLGTMTDSEKIFADLGLRSSERVEFVPEYSSEQLSILLADCAVGLFPSYVEGFGLAILEQLAAGIPTIAFDVPGPRDIFGADGRDFLVPAGDVEAIAQRALDVLDLAPNEYEALATRSRAIAERFQWEKIAADTIERYRGALARHGRARIVFTEPFGVASVEGGGGGRILRSLLRDAPLPFLCVSTLPQKPTDKIDNEIHLPTRPHFGRIEHTRFMALPNASAPLFRRRFKTKLARICRKVNARALHAIAHGGLDFHYGLTVAQRLNIPFFLQVHDDAVYTGGGRARHDVMSRCLADAWSAADACFVVSKELGEEYNRRYGARDFVVVTDGVDQFAAAPRPAANNLRIYFMGLFHLEYEPNLQALTAAIELVDLVRQRTDSPGRAPNVTRSITLRCGFVRPHLHKPPVKVLPYGSEADVQSDFTNADWLYLPLPFDEEHRAFVAYSLSTKMVSYLASGIPIIYHGPPGTAVYNLLAQNRAAALITTLDPKEIARTLRTLLGSAEAEMYAANALTLARRDFQRRDQHRKFWRPILQRLSA